MKVLLYKPNDLMVAEEDGTHNLSRYDSAFPYSLATVGAVLRQRGHKIFGLDPRVQKINPDRTLSYIRELAPDVIIVNVSVMAIDLDLVGIREIKKDTGCKIIALVCLGFEEEVMRRYPEIDVLIRREWSYASADALDAFGSDMSLNSIKGIYFREGDKIKKTEPREHVHLDEIPLPAYDVFPVKKYNHYQIMMTAGCRHHCVFCHFGRYPRGGWEHKNIDRIIQEIKEFKKFGNKFFRIIDSELTLDKEFVKQLLKKFIDEKINIVFDVNTRASSLDDELADLLKHAGCLSVGYGVESGVQKIMDLNLKDLTFGQVKECQKILDYNKIYSRAYFLIGLMGDTRETIKETFRFIKEDLGTRDASFDIVIPYPDTPFYTYLKQRGWLQEFTIDNLIWIYKNVYGWPQLRDIPGKKPFWRLEDVTLDDLLDIQKQYYNFVPHSNDREKFFILLQRHPGFILNQIMGGFRNPKAIIARVFNIITGK